ncbi:hypothetical protein B0H11DRAFT_2262812 [Mycena galericulata]|nr:hypothetical protein B0H11DRAFT_2262812 [Mycena galericulata]
MSGEPPVRADPVPEPPVPAPSETLPTLPSALPLTVTLTLPGTRPVTRPATSAGTSGHVPPGPPEPPDHRRHVLLANPPRQALEYARALRLPLHHARVDWRLADHEEPVLAEFDPAAIIPKETLPEAEEKAKRARVKLLNGRIRRWFKYRVRKLRKHRATSHWGQAMISGPRRWPGDRTEINNLREIFRPSTGPVDSRNIQNILSISV